MNVLNSAREYAYFITPYLLISDEMKKAFYSGSQKRSGCADYHTGHTGQEVCLSGNTFLLQQTGKKGCADF